MVDRDEIGREFTRTLEAVKGTGPQVRLTTGRAGLERLPPSAAHCPGSNGNLFDAVIEDSRVRACGDVRGDVSTSRRVEEVGGARTRSRNVL